MESQQDIPKSWHRELLGETKALMGGTWQEARSRVRLLAAIAVGIGLLALWMMPHDPQWVRAVIDGIGPEGTPAAKAFSFYGDFPIGTLGLSIVIFSIGRKVRRLSFPRLAVGCLLAASIAGISVNLVRSTAGRPRPMAGMKDGFYGPSLQYELHGFPSAHAATSMATAAVFVIPAPFIGVPMLGLAAGVSWSRMHLWCHHPTDVTVGALVGLLVGLGFGLVIRRRNILGLDLGA